MSTAEALAPTTSQNQDLGISGDELKIKLQNEKEPTMVFDIGDKDRYEREHIPGSKFVVCDEKTISNLLPKLPKDINIVLVGEDEKYLKEMAELGRNKGKLKTKYLKGGLAAWKWEKTKQQDPQISSSELKKVLDEGKTNNKKLFLLDVRESDEFKQWNIGGSINIPMGKVPHYLHQIPKYKEIVTICPHGNRSGMTTFLLHRLGYNVKTLEEGLKGWSSAFEYATKEFTVDSKQKAEKLKVVQVRRIGKGCMSYVIGLYTDKKEEEQQERETVVIDPVFPNNEYQRIANVEFYSPITKVFDTHLHADHVSAARDLAKKVNANLYLSSYEDYSFVKEEEKKRKEKEEENQEHQQHLLLRENDTYNVGSKENEIILKVIHTPGHTEGGLSFLVGNKLLFTGDTLFVDNIGRPDLRDKAEEFAGMLYNTLHNKIFGLSNKEEILVFPAHIDKNIREEEIVTATLADIEKRSKYLNLKKDEFVKKMASMIMPTPPQYKEIIDMNKGEKPLLSISEIQDLEMGPNRCGVS